MTTPVLKLTDGTTSISLVTPGGQKGFHLDNWLPEIANYKGGGIRRNNSRADGESLSGKQWANVTEEFRTIVDGEDQDAVIITLQNLRRLFEKASDYWTTPWQNEPVWIEASGSCETNTRYSIVIRGHMPQDGNPHAQPFFDEPSVIGETGSGFLISVERQPWWLGKEPGSQVCVKTDGLLEWAYEAEWAIAQTIGNSRARDLIRLQTNTMLAATLGTVYRSVDNGATWVNVVAGFAGQAFIFVELSTGRVIAGEQSNIWRSDDDGQTWQLATGVPAGNCEAATVLASGRILVSDTNNIWYSDDNGNSWTNNGSIAGSRVSSLLQISTGRVIASLADQRVYSSDDNGITWAELAPTNGVTETLAKTSQGLIIGAKESGIDPAMVYALESNNATVWKELFDIGAGWVYRALYVTDDDIIYFGANAGAANGRVYRSIDDGQTFQNWASPGFAGIRLDDIVCAADGSVIVSDYVGAVPGVDIWRLPGATIELGQEATCTDDTHIANKLSLSNFTDIQTYDASGPAFTAQFPAAAFPFNLFPAVMANGDALVLSTRTAVLNSGPFSNVVFDVSTAGTGTYTITWYYPTAGAAFPPPGANWNTLTVNDETGEFQIVGVNGLYFVPPDDWAAIAINGITGYHIVGLISAVAGNPTSPQQDNRDVYSAIRPGVDAAQIGGDIPGLARIRAHNRSDYDLYATYSDVDLLTNRVVVGLRSTNRGTNFVPVLNLSDTQNIDGVQVAAGTGTTIVDKRDAPPGRMAQHVTPPTGNLADYADAVTVSITSSIAREFYGTFHAYVRAQLEETGTPAGDDTSVQVRLVASSGSGGISKTTKHRRFVGYDPNGETFKDWQLLNMGRLDFPVSDLFKETELSDELQITVQVSSASGTSLNVNLYDIWLVPVDEWAGDFIDVALEDDSGIGVDNKLDIDSVTLIKRRLRALVRNVDFDELIKASYQPIAPGPAILQANADQRLWFLTARAAYRGEQTGAGSATVLQDSYADFLRAGVKVGMIAYNETTLSSAKITAVARQQITTVTIAGNWNANDNYLIICNGVYKSEPWNAHSVQLTANHRYLSFRGNR